MRKVICVQVKDEQRYIREWIDYHLSIGFDCIYVYEDYGSTSHLSVLEEYIANKQVVLTNLAQTKLVPQGGVDIGWSTQWLLLQWFLDKAKKEHLCDWVAFIDVDEFIVFEDGYNLDKLLEEFEDYPAIHLAWLMFGANGHVKRPNVGVMEAYTRSLGKNFEFESSTAWCVKSVVNVNADATLESNHRTLHGVDTNFEEGVRPLCFKKAWINHYFTKSWEDYCERMQRKGNMRNHDRTYDRFFMCNPDMKPFEDELLQEVRWNSTNADTMWISKKHKIISGGNVSKLKELRERKSRINNISDQLPDTEQLYCNDPTPFQTFAVIIKKGLAVIHTPKNGTSTIATLGDKYKGLNICPLPQDVEYKHFNEINDGIWERLRENVLQPIDDVKGENKIVAIYRDPIQRVLSAWHTLEPDITLDEYLKKVVDTFYYAPINKIDKHIAPQSIQYDASCVDLFVELKDLPSFLCENGFENIETNKSPSKEYDADILAKYNSTLKQIYASDYNMIANIPNDKKYKAV